MKRPLRRPLRIPARSPLVRTVPWEIGGGKLPGPALVHGITGWTSSTNYYTGSGSVGVGSSTMTFALLMRRTGALNSGGIPFAKSGLSNGHLFIFDTANDIAARVYDGSAKTTPFYVLTDVNKWYLLVATLASNTLTLYAQGVSTGTRAVPSAFVGNTIVNSIGSRNTGAASPANTIIAGAATCDSYAMSAAEVAALYQRVKVQNHLPALPGETARWDVWSQGQGAPASWASSASASAPLTRTGSLTQSTYSSEWGA